MNPPWLTRLRTRLRPRAGRIRLRGLVAGFAVIALVIALLIGVSLSSMSEIRDRLDQLTSLLQSKNEAVATMRENLYLRLVSTRDMLVMKDPFQIDDEAQRFHIYGERIGQAYLRFRELATDPEELALTEQFMDQASHGMPLLRSAVNELIGGKRPGEIVPLLNRAFETQKQALDTLRRLQEQLQAQSLRLSQEAVTRYERTRVLIITLTIIALLLVLAIAVVVTRLVSQHASELEQQHRRYKTLFEANRDAVLIVSDGRIVESNRRALDWFDYDGRATLAGRGLEALSAADAAPARDLERTLTRVAERGGTFEWMFRGRDGQPFFGEVSVTPLPGAASTLQQLVIRDVTARTLALQKMSHDATHDPLTGLANRREFERRAAQAIEDARAQAARHVLCFLDLDKFKEVNDLAGHAAGDTLLKQVADLLKSRVRAADLAARLGGDEFGLLLENCSLERAAAILHNITDGVEALRFSAAGKLFRIGVSVGMLEFTADGPALEQALHLVDQACYDAKRSGDRIRVIRADGTTGTPPPLFPDTE